MEILGDKMKKIFYMDTETTGLDPKSNDIIQLAYLIEIDGEIKEEGNLFVQPFSYENISLEALVVNKKTVEEIKTYPTPIDVYRHLQSILNKYINRYNKLDKFIPCGYNVRFDIDFLQSFFLKNNDKWFGAFFDYHFIDPMPIINVLNYKGSINLVNAKLITACENFGITIDAHDALSDIKATRELMQKIMKEYLK
jgi:DNA polymerase-3 subunit epsilon